MKRHNVRSEDTNGKLKGEPSPELISASEDAPSGLVWAYRDDAGVWQHVPAHDCDRMRMLGHNLITVWVD